MLVKHAGEKVNFIDRLDQFVGYDLGQCCCEYADYYIFNSDGVTLNDDEVFSHNLIFTEASIELPENLKEYLKAEGVYEDDCVTFKLAGLTGVYYLVLFNVHNGYYAHGYTFKIGDVSDQGYL